MLALVKQTPRLYKTWDKGLQIVEKDIPAVHNPSDVQIKVTAAGICGTDVGIYNSKDSLKNMMSSATAPNVTIGHEFCGRITDAGPKAKLRLAELALQRAAEHSDLDAFIQKRTAAQLTEDSDFLEFINRNFINSRKDRKSTRLNSSHSRASRMPSSA